MGLQNEIDILTHVDHPNIVKLYEVFEDIDHYSLVMELMTGGELFDNILQKEVYTEKEASDTIRPIIDAIQYCH
jgi:calcium/calmodulin-dependent protein kinase I